MFDLLLRAFYGIKIIGCADGQVPPFNTEGVGSNKRATVRYLLESTQFFLGIE